MKLLIRQLFAFFFFSICLNSPIFAQTSNEEMARKYACSKDNIPQAIEYFDNLAKHNKQLTEFYTSPNTPLPLFYREGFARNLVKPYFPQIAKEHRFFGSIKVQTITNELGKVIFARAVSGNPILRRESQKAACYSKFISISFDGKPVKFSFTIQYNFIKP